MSKGMIKMNLFVYSDESGVFDAVHEDYFVFGGLIFLGKEQRDNESRKYLNVERTIRTSTQYENGHELKASYISNKDKGKIFRSLNHCYKFGVIIDLKRIHTAIFESKKTKQRYLDYAFKIALKRAIQNMAHSRIIKLEDITNIYLFADEHSTATNGKYELREAIEQEFKFGTFNNDWMKFYPPITPQVDAVKLEFCDSSKKPLIRAADIVANRIYFIAKKNMPYEEKETFFITYLP
ncbi:MAG: DUF3800 domain-containing protein [Ruminococcus sp.]|nr:DUF3800 domain-containing protein [Ruminococcus sp.]